MHSAINYKTPTYELEVRKVGPHGGATGPVEIWTITNPLSRRFREQVPSWDSDYRFVRSRRIASRWN